MYLHIYFVFLLIAANPVGIGVIYVMAPLVVSHKPTEQIPKLVNYCVKSILFFNPSSADSVVGVCDIGSCWVCDVIGLAVGRQ